MSRSASLRKITRALSVYLKSLSHRGHTHSQYSQSDGHPLLSLYTSYSCPNRLFFILFKSYYYYNSCRLQTWTHCIQRERERKTETEWKRYSGNPDLGLSFDWLDNAKVISELLSLSIVFVNQILNRRLHNLACTCSCFSLPSTSIRWLRIWNNTGTTENLTCFVPF